ncbi:pro-sigmaK processing inhibitor BofA family protein [Lysinibacillus sp. 54212]|uniref:pro-sigmaK processing inhibitor BofA family protein n=1 Tax=Lysinibacillus sp. 54212 TaxID=3119829 RepID=UPI002FCB9CD1
MYVFVLGAVCMLLFFVLLIGRNYKEGVWLERLSLFWFRFAWSVLLLFILHLVLANFNMIVPINLFSIATITILGLPGILTVVFIAFIK